MVNDLSGIDDLELMPLGGGYMVRRERLMNELIAKGRKAGIVVLYAPDGFGKTSVLLQYTHEVKCDPTRGPVRIIEAEPDDHFSKGTHCVDLTESTIQANSRLFDSIDDVPRQAYTMGTQTIMYARMILVVANGEAKAQAVHDMCYGPVTPECPASILQLHTNCVVVADEAALSLCE